MGRREKGVEVSTVRVETAKENDQECTRGLHKSAGRAQAFMEIRRPSKAEAARDCHSPRK